MWIALQPLFSLVMVGLILVVAIRAAPPEVDGAAGSLYGANDLLIGVFVLWIFLRVNWCFQQVPVLIALALLGYAAYSWWRFSAAGTITYAVATVVLGSGRHRHRYHLLIILKYDGRLRHCEQGRLA